MREIVFDTETTGLDPAEDRVIEFGAIELVNRFPTGRSFHAYFNPQGRRVHPEAQAVHGIGNADLADKPVFGAVYPDLAAFIDGAVLVAHNANFDAGFINAELNRLGLGPLDPGMIVDTLAIARRKNPMGPNSLDALCRRYGIDNSRRTKHGALLDSELLAEVYIELMGGRQAALVLDAGEPDQAEADEAGTVEVVLRRRPAPLPGRLGAEDLEAHRAMVRAMGPSALWARFDPACLPEPTGAPEA